MSIFIFSHYRSMATISCHSNQSSYPIGTKTVFVPPAFICYMWNIVRIGFMASEKMPFKMLTDGRRTDYTLSSPMSLRLKWAENSFLLNTIYGPRQANLCLRAFRHDKFQLRMPSHSEEPGIWLSVWRFLLTHCLYERAAKVLARLRGCAGSPEPSLLA